MTGRSILGWSEVGLERGDTRVFDGVEIAVSRVAVR